jgi:hypothetical protein
MSGLPRGQHLNTNFLGQIGMNELPYLLDEICAGVEVYFTGRTGGQYLKTAFILCDDYSELTAKLFLLTDDKHWRDKNAGGGFKNYDNVQQDVRGVLAAKRPADLPRLTPLQANMQARRNRRNDFFHSTHLLDLNVTHRMCVEAFCDLFSFGELLLGADWQRCTAESRNLETLVILLLLEKKSFGNPSVWPKVDAIIKKWPRNIAHSARRGVHLTVHPEDMHLRLTVIHGHKELRDKLEALLL